MGSLTQAVDAAEREVERAPRDAAAWERLGRLRLRRFDRAGARDGARARVRDRADASRACSTSRSSRTSRATRAPRCRRASSAAELAPESAAAWSRLAHALARTDRTAECLAACERALALRDDPEVRDLREQVLALAPRELASESAAAYPAPASRSCSRPGASGPIIRPPSGELAASGGDDRVLVRGENVTLRRATRSAAGTPGAGSPPQDLGQRDAHLHLGDAAPRQRRTPPPNGIQA